MDVGKKEGDKKQETEAEKEEQEMVVGIEELEEDDDKEELSQHCSALSVHQVRNKKG